MAPPESAPASAPSLAQPDAPEPGPPPARCIACHGTGKLGWGPCQFCSGGGLSPAASSGASKCIFCKDTGKGLFGDPCGRCSGGPGAALTQEDFKEKFKNADLSFLDGALRGFSASSAGSASGGPCFSCNSTGTTLFGPCWRCAKPASDISGKAAEAAMIDAASCVAPKDEMNPDDAAFFWSPGATLRSEPDLSGALYFKPRPPAEQ